MNRVLHYLPEVQGEEFFYLEKLTDYMSDQQIAQFAGVYRVRRRDPNNILLLTLIGFISVAGIQRFYVGQIGMGLLYFFTAGLCLIGTIVDLINHKAIAQEYNEKIANEVARML